LFFNSLARSMKNSPNDPSIPDTEVAMRIALVREMTEAAHAGAIGWDVRDRRLRSLFCVQEDSRAFDSSRPSYGR
jgi:hypothetical protein